MRSPLPDPAAEPSDAELLARCRAGDRRGWDSLVHRYQRLIYTVPRRAGLGEHEAADVFQATFSRLFEHLDTIAQPDRVQAWLVTTARRETLRRLQQLRRERPFAAAPAGGDTEDREDPALRIPDPDPLPPERLQSLQQQDRLWRALRRLDGRSQAMIELLFLRDPPPAYREIAERLQIAEGSIGPTRARCLEKLRDALAKEP